MNKSPNIIIADLLNVIDYDGDREKFTREFLELCSKEALINYIQTLPEAKQTELKDASEAGKDPKDILNDFLSDKEFGEAISNASESVFSDYLKTITPSLSQDQKNKLNSYLSSDLSG